MSETTIKPKSSMVKRILKRAALPSVVALLGVAAMVPFNMGGCTAQQVMGTVSAIQKGSSALSLNERDEDGLGQTVAIRATSTWGLVQDSKQTQYLTLIGTTLVSTSPRPDLKCTFGILNDDQINAVSGPNGYITVTRGTLALCQDESELAGVLAHELAHVLNKDGLKAVKDAAAKDALVTGVSAADSNAERAQAWSGLADGLGSVMTSGYSREAEAKADKDAVSLLVAAGYDPRGYVRFLERTRTVRQGSARGGALLATHGSLDQRIIDLNAQIARRTEKGEWSPAKPGAVLADRYVAWIRR